MHTFWMSVCMYIFPAGVDAFAACIKSVYYAYVFPSASLSLCVYVHTFDFASATQNIAYVFKCGRVESGAGSINRSGRYVRDCSYIGAPFVCKTIFTESSFSGRFLIEWNMIDLNKRRRILNENNILALVVIMTMNFPLPGGQRERRYLVCCGRLAYLVVKLWCAYADFALKKRCIVDWKPRAETSTEKPHTEHIAYGIPYTHAFHAMQLCMSFASLFEHCVVFGFRSTSSGGHSWVGRCVLRSRTSSLLRHHFAIAALCGVVCKCAEIIGVVVDAVVRVLPSRWWNFYQLHLIHYAFTRTHANTDSPTESRPPPPYARCTRFFGRSDVEPHTVRRKERRTKKKKTHYKWTRPTK